MTVEKTGVKIKETEESWNFIGNIGAVFLALACAFSITGYVSWVFWNALFGGVFAEDFEVMSVEKQAFKPLFNILMYAMPYGFWFLAVGLFAVGIVICCVHGVRKDIKQWLARRRQGGQHA